MVDVVFQNLDEVVAWLRGLPDAVQASLFAQSSSLVAQLQTDVQGKLDGEVLQSKTGRLRDSIAQATEETDDGVSASVFVDGDVPYAAIQEYGGATKAHIIEAVNAKALAFNMGGKQAFFTHVNHPGSIIPERSYLNSSLDDMSDDITEGMSDGLGDVVAD